MERGAFLRFIAAVGTKAAAQRFGVTESTVRRWRQRGAPPDTSKHRDTVDRRVRAWIGAVKAAKGRGRHTRFATEDRPEISLPPRASTSTEFGGDLTPDQVLPTRDPFASGEIPYRLRNLVERARNYRQPRIGREGTVYTVKIDRQFIAGEDATEEIERVTEIFRRSGRNWLRVKGLFATAFADNPRYRNSRLAGKGHKWAEWWSWSIEVPRQATDAGVANAVLEMLEGNVFTRRTRPGRIPGVQAETRVVWWLYLFVDCFDIDDDGGSFLAPKKPRRRR